MGHLEKCKWRKKKRKSYLQKLDSVRFCSVEATPSSVEVAVSMKREYVREKEEVAVDGGGNRWR